MSSGGEILGRDRCTLQSTSALSLRALYSWFMVSAELVRRGCERMMRDLTCSRIK